MAASGNLYTAWIDIGLKGFDRIQKGMKDAVSEVKRGMGDIGGWFSTTQGAIERFVGAANPLAMNTFGGSIELLKARIGQSFTPYILQASRAIQDLGNWVKNLDPDTKKQIASWVMYGTAAAGAVFVFSKFASVLTEIYNHPLAVAFLAAAAAAMKLNEEVSKVNKSMLDSIDVNERMKKGVLTEKEYKGSAAEAIETSGQNDAQKLLDARLTRNKLVLEGRMAALKGGNRAQLGNDIDTVKEGLGLENITNDSKRKVNYSLKELGLIDDLISRLESGKGGPKFTAESEIKKRTAGNQLLLGGVGGAGGGGSIGSLDSAYNKINAGALGMNDIQREILKIQMDSLAETRDTARDTSSILDTLRQATGH